MAMPIQNRSLIAKKSKDLVKKRQEAEQKKREEEERRKQQEKRQDWRPSYQQGTGSNYSNPNMPTKKPEEITGKSAAKSGNIWKGLEKKKTTVDELLGKKSNGQEAERRAAWDAVHGQGSYDKVDRRSVNWDRMNAQIDALLKPTQDWRPSYQQGTGSNFYNPNMPARTVDEILNGPSKKEEKRTFTKAEDQRGYPHSFDMPPARPYKDYVGNVSIGGQERPMTLSEIYENADPQKRGEVARKSVGADVYRDWLSKNPFLQYANLGEDKEKWQKVQQDTDLVIQEGYDELQKALDEWEPGDPFYDNLIDEIKAGAIPDVISTPVRSEENDRALMAFYFGDEGLYDAWEGDPERERILEELWAPIEDGSLAAYRDRREGNKETQTETEYAQRMNEVAAGQLQDIARLEGEKQAYNDLINQYDDNITMPEFRPEYDKGETNKGYLVSDDYKVNDIHRIASFIGGGNELKTYAEAYGTKDGKINITNDYQYAMMMTDGRYGSVDEIGIFLNLYNQAMDEGREPTEARAFLDGLQTALRSRYSEAEKINYAELARNYPVVASLASLAAHQINTYVDLPRHIAHLFGDTSVEDPNSNWYQGSKFSDIVEGTIAKDLGGTWGKVYTNVMQSLSNLGRALAAPKGSKIWQSIAGLGGFFLQVDQEATARYLQDHSYEEAATMGAVDALFEVVEEFLPFETMLGTANSGLGISMLLNGLSELGQEFTGATVFDKIKGILTGKDEEQEREDEIIAQQGYLKDGKWVDLQNLDKAPLMEAARVQAAKEFWTQAVEQGLGGFFGGMLGGTYGTIANYTGMSRTGKQIQSEENTVEGVSGGEQLVEAAAGMDGTESQKMAKEIQEKQEQGKKVTNYEFGKLAATISQETNEKIRNITRDVVEGRVFAQLQKSGVSRTEGRAIAEAFTNGLLNGKLTAKERATIASSEAALGLWRSYNSLMSEDFQGVRQEVEQATAGMRSVAQKLGELMGNKVRSMSQVSAEVDAALKQNGTAEAAMDSLAKKSRIISDRFAEEAKKYAKGNEGNSAFVDDSVRIYLAAMTQGQMPKVSIKKADADAMFQAAQAEFAENEENRILKQERIVPGNGKATYEGAEYGTAEWEAKVTKGEGLHSRIKMQMSVIAEIAKRMGYTVNFVNQEGQRALVHGWESRDGSITLNIAGKQMSGLSKNMIATIAHEMTHWLEQNSKDGYARLRTFILKGLQDKGVNVTNRLLEIMDNQNSVLRDVAIKQAEERGETIDEKKIQEIYDQQALDVNGAMAELVAQSCEELFNTEALRAELEKNDPTLYGQLKAFVRRFIAQLNAALKGLDGSLSREARALTQWKEDIAKLWLGAREEALGRSEEGTATEGSGERFSTAAVDQEYMTAVENGDMETAQRLVDEAARAAGYTDEAYHGTSAFGFTEFDMAASQGQIFVAYNSDLASTYVENGEVKNISDAVNYNDLSGEELARVFIEEKGTENGGEFEDARFISHEQLEQRVYDHIARIERDARYKSWTEEQRKAMINFIAGRCGVDASVFESAKTPGELESQVIRTILEGKTAYAQNGIMMVKMMINPIIENYAVNKDGKKLTIREQDGLLHAVAFDLIKALENKQGLFEVREEGTSTYWPMKRDEITGKLNGGVYRLFTKPGKQLVVDAGYEAWDSIPVEAVQEAAGYSDAVMHAWPAELGLKTRRIAQWAESQGYDSVRINNVYDDGGMGEFSEYETEEGDIGIFFNQRNVKSADAIVYDNDGNVIPLSERFDKYHWDLRYSTAQRDDAYMAAVESGDMATAQRMVDEAAQDAGYNLAVFHGTGEEFNEFERGFEGIHLGNYSQAGQVAAQRRMIFGNDNANVKRLYAKINNPFIIGGDIGTWTPQNIARVLLDRNSGETTYGTYGNSVDISGSDINLTDEQRDRLFDLSYADEMEVTDEYWDTLANVLEQNGFDGIQYNNEYEGDRESFSYIALRQGDVKSAAPVTYDDNGNIIPLSERFNAEETDIRYSVALEDATHPGAEMFSVAQVAQANGLRFDEDEVVLYNRKGEIIDGVKVKVTEDMIENTPIGMLINMARDGVTTKAGKVKFKATISAETAAAQKKMFTDLMNMIARYKDSNLVWEIAGSMLYSAMKSNSDPQYSTTVDFGTVCAKTQEIINVMSRVMLEKGRGLTREEVLMVYNETANAGLTVPCPVCYVFSRWMGVPSLLNQMSQYQKRFVVTTKDKNGNTVINKKATQARVDAYIQEAMDTYGSKAALDKAKVSIMNRMKTQENNRSAALVVLNSKNATAEEKEAAKKKHDEAIKNLDALTKDLGVVEAYNWVTQALCRETSKGSGKYVVDDAFELTPDSVLFDLRKTGEFAKFTKNWRYRNTRGAGMGKAIMPYSGETIGDIIFGTERKSEIKNPFLNMKAAGASNGIKNAIIRARKQNLIGGQRLQSTSDYRPEWGLDYIMTFLELQAIGSKVQMYTKVAEAVDLLASMHADVNLSIMGKGSGFHEATAEEIAEAKKNTRRGKDLKSRMGEITGEDGVTRTYILDFSDITGMDYNTAKALKNKHDSVQMILVGHAHSPGDGEPGHRLHHSVAFLREQRERAEEHDQQRGRETGNQQRLHRHPERQGEREPDEGTEAAVGHPDEDPDGQGADGGRETDHREGQMAGGTVGTVQRGREGPGLLPGGAGQGTGRADLPLRILGQGPEKGGREAERAAVH